MTFHACSEVERCLWRYVDRELPAVDLAAISAHLDRCADCKQRYLEAAREANAYRMTFQDGRFGESFVRRWRGRGAAEGAVGTESESRTLLRRRRRSPSRGRARGAVPAGYETSASMERLWSRGRWRRVMTVAAMLLCVPAVLSVGVFLQRPTIGSFSLADGTVRLLREGSDEAKILRRGDMLPGDEYELAAESALTLLVASSSPDRFSSLELHGPARFVLGSGCSPSSFDARLVEGTLHAAVVGDAERSAFRVSTPHAVAVVVGTSFTIESRRGQGTLLTVDEGTVRFGPVARSSATTEGAAARRQPPADRLPVTALLPVTVSSGTLGVREGASHVVSREQFFHVVPGVDVVAREASGAADGNSGTSARAAEETDAGAIGERAAPGGPDDAGALDRAVRVGIGDDAGGGAGALPGAPRADLDRPVPGDR